MKKTIGGDRLGSGKKMTADLHGFERSTHDLSYLWRSSMSAGTLVPFLTEVALPGDTHDINLNVDIKTHPTIGPLFGSYKVQLDVFQFPVRLYQGMLHMNAVGIGNRMGTVKLPQVYIEAGEIDWNGDVDNQQINPSSIFSHLNIRGVGRQIPPDEPGNILGRAFNAVPYLGYWDIYKNYYANKQEEIGMVVHSTQAGVTQNIIQIQLINNAFSWQVPYRVPTTEVGNVSSISKLYLVSATPGAVNPEYAIIRYRTASEPSWRSMSAKTMFATFTIQGGWLEASNYQLPYDVEIQSWRYASANQAGIELEITEFPLTNIDVMRVQLLKHTGDADAYVIQKETAFAPYSLPLQQINSTAWSKQGSQEGLALKTYQSDLFNNWMQTEWIDGANGISAVTAIDTSEGNFTIDTLNLSKKVYNMLNRIAISGGSYDDWLDAVYDHHRYKMTESPVYHGGLIRELAFQEVVSNSESSDGVQPLGTLAGRGVLTNKNKGGHITIKTDEISYVMGIISLTPRVDYSQGNKWDVNLKTMDDFHKPNLDEIGFQDLITDQMAFWDTTVTADPSYSSAGKQPAWINYMTNVNVVRGNFAIEDNEMFMTLNRRYEMDPVTHKIKDLTTYIDPSKFNFIFAQTELDAMNFWAQISVDMTVRRKMSAKIMPNL